MLFGLNDITQILGITRLPSPSVGLRMIADGMSLIQNSGYNLRMILGIFSDAKKSGFGAKLRKDIQYLFGDNWRWAIIKSQKDFLIDSRDSPNKIMGNGAYQSWGLVQVHLSWRKYKRFECRENLISLR